jgi:hypothetical protein
LKRIAPSVAGRLAEDAEGGLQQNRRGVSKFVLHRIVLASRTRCAARKMAANTNSRWTRTLATWNIRKLPTHTMSSSIEIERKSPVFIVRLRELAIA